MNFTLRCITARTYLYDPWNGTCTTICSHRTFPQNLRTHPSHRTCDVDPPEHAVRTPQAARQLHLHTLSAAAAGVVFGFAVRELHGAKAALLFVGVGVSEITDGEGEVPLVEGAQIDDNVDDLQQGRGNV